MRAIRLTCLALLLVGITGVAAFAKPAVAILGLEVVDKSGTPTAQDTQVGQELTLGLRSRAKAGTGPYQIAPGSEKELIDEKLLKNCDDEKPNCMAAIGNELSAEFLIYGKIEKQGGQYAVTVILFDVKNKKRLQTVPTQFGLNDTASGSLQSRAKKLYGDLTGQSDSCTITVKTTGGVDRATILVNGEAKGNITNGVGQVTGLTEGRYTIAVEAQDFTRWERPDVTCTAGQTTNVGADMAKSSGGGVGPSGGGNGSGSGSGSDSSHTGTVSHSSNKGIWKAMAWGGIVGTLAGGGVMIYGFSKMSGADKFDGNGLDLTGAGPIDSMTNMPITTDPRNQKAHYTDAACGTTEGNIVAGKSNAANQAFASGCSGKTLRNVGIGLTIGFGVVAAVGIVMAYARSDNEKPVSVNGTGTSGRRTKRAPFAIVPVVSPNGGGASFAMEW